MSCSNRKKEIENLIQNCEKIHADNPEKCIESGQKVLDLIKSDTSGFQNEIATAAAYIGEGYLRLNKFTEARKFLESIVSNKSLSESKALMACYANLAIAYSRMGETEKSLKYYIKILAYHKKTNDKENIARDYVNIGIFLTSIGKYHESIKNLEKAYQLFHSLKMETDMMRTFSYNAVNYYYYGDTDKALENKLTSLSYFEKTKEYALIASEYSNVAVYYKNFGDYEKAIDYSLRSLKIKENLGNKFSIAFTLNNLGVFYKEWGNYRKAMEYYQTALKIREELNDKKGLSVTLNNIGSALMDKNRYDEALKYFQRSLKMKHQTGDELGKIIVLENISSIYQKREQLFDKSELLLNEALKLSQKIGNENKILEIYFQLAEIMIMRGKIEKAAEYLQKTTGFIEKNENDLLSMEYYRIFSDLHSAQKKYQKALAYYRKYSDIKDKIFSEEKNKTITEMQIKYEIEKKENEKTAALAKAEALSRKNKIIQEQKNKLQKTLDKLHKSEIHYNFISEELNRHIKTTLIGESEAIKNIIEMISIVADSDKTNVLITGESGTGKEIVARNIHKFSNRKKRNFYAVNSSAIPDTLFESQFFGHEKNAFTGADSTKIGWFEIADKSTLFLDEIGTMSLEQQVKLLRVLEEHNIVRVGSHNEIKVDVRMICASNIELLNLIEQKKFRTDLYHRISTFVINIPPLRERKEDIPPLLRHFVIQFSKTLNKKINRITDDVTALLWKYDYPGNVRELRNIIERAVLVADSSTLKPEHFIIPQMKSKQKEDFILQSLQEIEIQAVKKALVLANFNQTKAAELLQIKRKAIERRIVKYKLQGFLQNRAKK